MWLRGYLVCYFTESGINQYAGQKTLANVFGASLLLLELSCFRNIVLPDTHDRLDWYLCTAPRKHFISWMFLMFPHIFYQIYCNNPTEITRNHFCGVFLKNHNFLREMFLIRLKNVTKKPSLLRCIWKKLSFEILLRYLSQWRSDWDLSQTSHAGWGQTTWECFFMLLWEDNILV